MKNSVEREIYEGRNKTIRCSGPLRSLPPSSFSWCVIYVRLLVVAWKQDDTFDDSSIFSYGSVGSAVTNGHGGRLPSSPSTLGAEQSDDDEDDEELRGRWGNNGVVVGGGEKADARQGHVSVILVSLPTDSLVAISTLSSDSDGRMGAACYTG